MVNLSTEQRVIGHNILCVNAKYIPEAQNRFSIRFTVYCQIILLKLFGLGEVLSAPVNHVKLNQKT